MTVISILGVPVGTQLEEMNKCAAIMAHEFSSADAGEEVIIYFQSAHDASAQYPFFRLVAKVEGELPEDVASTVAAILWRCFGFVPMRIMTSVIVFVGSCHYVFDSPPMVVAEAAL